MIPVPRWSVNHVTRAHSWTSLRLTSSRKYESDDFSRDPNSKPVLACHRSLSSQYEQRGSDEHRQPRRLCVVNRPQWSKASRDRPPLPQVECGALKRSDSSCGVATHRPWCAYLQAPNRSEQIPIEPERDSETGREKPHRTQPIDQPVRTVP
jgi:hypothetical protein